MGTGKPFIHPTRAQVIHQCRMGQAIHTHHNPSGEGTGVAKPFAHPTKADKGLLKMTAAKTAVTSPTIAARRKRLSRSLEALSSVN
ncbi:hypothetical protein [Stenomitos frigidus]|uniref:hypothetical protein n=1 Tax=Stenomitos frigidus TaxID=1886765 RepID=UPI000D060E80|nr:hypothetical protein [Stenomitos frigidus]